MSAIAPRTPKLLLVTANARFSHTALSLRFLKANLEEFVSDAEIMEFALEDRVSDMVEKILTRQPKIVGLSVYIWNSELMAAVACQLKQVAPDLVIVAGGPEVSFDTENHPVFPSVDYVIQGEGEQILPKLIRQILSSRPPSNKIVAASPVDLSRILLPYHLYEEQDIRHRIIYVETSRGCPFQCAFCLSLTRTERRRIGDSQSHPDTGHRLVTAACTHGYPDG